MVWLGWVRLGEVRRGEVWLGLLSHYMRDCGMVRYSMARSDEAMWGAVRYGKILKVRRINHNGYYI